MKIATTLFLFVVVGCTWRETLGTCVFQSDFGFTLNCAFKKSGLFRVRNLGGVKGYVGLGFSVGDELGFRESLSNLEATRRRSAQAGKRDAAGASGAVANREQQEGAQNPRAFVPPFKPLPSEIVRPMTQQPERQRLVVQQNSTAIKTVPAPSLALSAEEILRHQQQQQLQQRQQEAKLKQQRQKLQQEALALQVLKQQRQQQQEAMRQQHLQKMQQQQQQLQTQQKQQQQTMAMQKKKQTSNPFLSSNGALPPFIAMPSSLSRFTERIGNNDVATPADSDNEVSKDDFEQLPLPGEEAASSVNKMTLLSLQPSTNMDSNQPTSSQQTDKRHSVSQLLPIQGTETSLKALAEASNITLEALEAAILLRQQQLAQKQQSTPALPTTTIATTVMTTTTASPVSKSKNTNSGPTKVMNAPREYYPVGYDKNFDDNFASRVDLPDTSFYCGDQKYFPGLYADEDLGCMVFHVCALTDDGLIMKSFLCPESTLFDQTILKCNWWFYVDCQASRSLYDSNIPISKSYQLMKALAFFSAYKSHDNGTTSNRQNSTDV